MNLLALTAKTFVLHVPKYLRFANVFISIPQVDIFIGRLSWLSQKMQPSNLIVLEQNVFTHRHDQRHEIPLQEFSRRTESIGRFWPHKGNVPSLPTFFWKRPGTLFACDLANVLLKRSREARF